MRSCRARRNSNALTCTFRVYHIGLLLILDHTARHTQSDNHLLVFLSHTLVSLPQLGSLVVVAGQIGLLPHSMCLVEEPHQAALSLTHVLSILLANRADWSSCLGGTCFCTTLHHISVAKQAWRKVCPMCCVTLTVCITRCLSC